MQEGVSFELNPHDPVRRDLNFVLQLSGHGTYSQQRRSVRLDAGKWAAFDVGRLSIVASAARCEQLILLIPHDQIDAGLDVQRIVSRPLPGATGASKVLMKTAVCLIEELPCISTQRAESLAQALCKFVSLAIHERLGANAATPSNRVSLRDRIRQYIDSHLRDPSLSLDRIAGQLNCTKRYLHKVFQGNGESLSAYILQQRLQRCRMDISKPELANLSITQIARSWGFTSVSHFSRAFRLRFGLSPRAVRRNARLSVASSDLKSKGDDETQPFGSQARNIAKSITN